MRIGIVAALACCLATAAHADAPAPDLGGRTALDLTGPTPDAPVAGAAVARGSSATTIGDCPDPATGQVLWLAENDAHEAGRIASASGVAREGTVLVLTPKAGKPLRFSDWSMPERPDADGDFVRYRYAGTLANDAWWRVEVQYGHDAPSSWLVNASSGEALHVHNGGETTTLSADGHWLATLDANSPPYRLAVVALHGAKAELAVDCFFTPTDRAMPTGCGFRGEYYEAKWGDAGSMSLEHSRSGWSLAGYAPGADCRAPR